MTKLEQAVCNAMEELKDMPCGGIGEDGPTLAEMDAYVEKHGQSMEDDAVYHTTQHVWRTLEKGIKEESNDDA